MKAPTRAGIGSRIDPASCGASESALPNWFASIQSIGVQKQAIIGISKGSGVLRGWILPFRDSSAPQSASDGNRGSQ